MSDHHAHGTFDVSITPAGAPDEGEGSVLGSMALAKVFHGEWEGTSKGTMLTASSSGTTGSAAYVAVERFTGTLGGRIGSFALVHRGVMSSAGRELTIGIVPDSGTGQLQGIAGRLSIDIAKDGTHHYDLDYSLP
ncbi:DUF3224 domain-containing protein [Luteibacter sp. UNCMF366Tsu5.1]|uniref:DUF3224 domain-containing protein n=1 Tax=Luteibacter sp. UNCMF366Tsu5.1 TaxID=1502758 RepID=UPI000908CF56|nr:DUF3224 domain-containing protein [Luteibacter sp. UNCMF366Tsu5.1]SFW32842.1 Protein of unknown function [Luteibacter sp. UNCMF366Tsu5.1]